MASRTDEPEARLCDFDGENDQVAPESRGHSFIVKIWLEEVVKGTRAGKWRGRITHVPGGESRYLQNLNEVAQFITPYLNAMGVRAGIRERVKRWLSLY